METNSSQEARRKRAVGMLLLDETVTNALALDALDDQFLVACVAYRARGEVITGEALIPRASWDLRLFRAYAAAMQRPH